MTQRELRECRLEILDAMHSLAEDPLGDATEARLLLEGLFERLETDRDGEEAEDGSGIDAG